MCYCLVLFVEQFWFLRSATATTFTIIMCAYVLLPPLQRGGDKHYTHSHCLHLPPDCAGHAHRSCPLLLPHSQVGVSGGCEGHAGPPPQDLAHPPATEEEEEEEEEEGEEGRANGTHSAAAEQQ